LTDELRQEAILFGRYLVDREPSADLIERYVEANQLLFANDAGFERELLDFARRHPWSIGMLDASAGILGGNSVLRKKLLLMTAILETTPEYVEQTQPRAASLPSLVFHVGTASARAAFNMASGLALRLVLRRRA